MAMQGPHQGAQKSTTNGRSFRVKCRSKLAACSSMGFPSNKGKWHLGQRGASRNRSPGRRTTESQWAQTTWIPSFIKPSSFRLGNQDGNTIGDDAGMRMRLILGGRRWRSQFCDGQINLMGGGVEYHGACA